MTSGFLLGTGFLQTEYRKTRRRAEGGTGVEAGIFRQN